MTITAKLLTHLSLEDALELQAAFIRNNFTSNEMRKLAEDDLLSLIRMQYLNDETTEKELSEILQTMGFEVLQKDEYNRLKLMETKHQDLLAKNNVLKTLLNPSLDQSVKEVFSPAFIDQHTLNVAVNLRNLGTIRNVLKHEGIHTIRDVLTVPRVKWDKTPGLGLVSITIITEILHALHSDLYLGMIPDLLEES